MSIRAFLLIPFMAASLAGCSGGSDEERSRVTEWLGEHTHLAVSGQVQGINFDVHLDGDDAANLYCHRFYTPLPDAVPDAEGNYASTDVYFAMKEIGGVIDVEGEPKEFTISYWRHDAPEGSALEVVPREFGAQVPEGKTWSDINLFNPGENLLSGLETAASSGTVRIHLNSGSPDPGGVMMSGGRTGEFVSVSWGPRERLDISATSDCQTMVVPWAQQLVAP